MSFISKIGLILAIALFAPVAEAEIISYKEAGQIAISKNPEIKAYKAVWESAKTKIPQVLSLDDPKIGLEYEQIPSGSRNPEDGMKMLTFEQMIPFPSKVYVEWQIANKEAEAAYAQYKKRSNEIISQVKSAYPDIFYLDKSIIINSEIRKMIVNLKKSAEARYSVGHATQADPIMAAAEYLLISNEIVNLQKEKEAAIEKINYLLVYSGTFETEAEISLPSVEGISKYEIRALNNRPEIIEMRAMLEVGDLEHLKSKMGYLPDTDLGIKKRVAGGWDAMVTFSVPLYFWKQGSQVAGDGFGREAAELSFQNMKNMTVFDVREAQIMAENAWRTMDLYKNSILPLSEQSLKVGMAAYQSGKIDFLTIFQIQKSYKEAKLKYYESAANYGKALAELEKIIGSDII